MSFCSQEAYCTQNFGFLNLQIGIFNKSKFCLHTSVPLKVITYQSKVQ